jgi:solute carrier family 35 protein F1/2
VHSLRQKTEWTKDVRIFVLHYCMPFLSSLQICALVTLNLFLCFQILAFVGYAVATFMFYSFVPFVLKLSGATMFNLSILTSDMWAVVIRIFFYHQQVDWLYYLAFAMVVVGLIIYSTTEKNFVPVPTIEGGNSNAQYQVLTNECEASRNESLAS